MGAGPLRPGRKGGSLPKLLQAVLIVSVAGALALWTAHIAQSGAAGDSGPPRLLLQGALELAQATQQPGALLHTMPDGDDGLQTQQQDGDTQQDPQAAEGVQAVPGQQEPTGRAAEQQPDPEWELLLRPEQPPQQPQQKQGSRGDDDEGDDWSADSSSSTSSSGGSDGPASSSAARAGADEPDQLTLNEDSDLAMFADAGTRCVVTPSHGKVGSPALVCGPGRLGGLAGMLQSMGSWEALLECLQNAGYVLFALLLGGPNAKFVAAVLLLPMSHTLQCTELSMLCPAGGAAVHRARDGAAPRHDVDGVDAGGARDAATRQPGGARGLLPAAVRCLRSVGGPQSGRGRGRMGLAALAALVGVGAWLDILDGPFPACRWHVHV